METELRGQGVLEKLPGRHRKALWVVRRVGWHIPLDKGRVGLGQMVVG